MNCDTWKALLTEREARKKLSSDSTRFTNPFTPFSIVDDELLPLYAGHSIQQVRIQQKFNALKCLDHVYLTTSKYGAATLAARPAHILRRMGCSSEPSPQQVFLLPHGERLTNVDMSVPLFSVYSVKPR